MTVHGRYPRLTSACAAPHGSRTTFGIPDTPDRSAPFHARPEYPARTSARRARSCGRAVHVKSAGLPRSARESATSRAPDRAGADRYGLTRAASIARNSASNASGLSFTPRRSTDCPRTGIASACNNRIAARAPSVNSRAWFAWITTHMARSVRNAAARAGVTRGGSAIGNRVCTRMVRMCGIADNAAQSRRAAAARA